jgi:hypothetical protein
MNPKMLLSMLLGGFVIFSLGVMVGKETRGKAATSAPMEADAPAVETVDPDSVRFVAYYFHGNVRCTTCNTIEARSESAITNFFAEALESGELRWEEVNYDTPENAHYRKDFELAHQSLVLVEEKGGKPVRWEMLHDVWLKVQDSPAIFEQYVVDSTIAFMAGGNS